MSLVQVWPYGATYVFQGTILNGGVTLGDHTYAIATQAGSELMLMYGDILNGDAAGRAGSVDVDDGTNILAKLLGNAQTIGAGARRGFPVSGTVGDNQAPSPLLGFISGGMRILATVSSVAISQDTAFAIVARIRGREPTVTLTGPAGSTATTNTNRVF